MQRASYYKLVYRVLVWVWGREPTVTDRLLVMHYVDTVYARTLSLRRQLVLFIIKWHLRDIKRNSE